MPAWQGLNSCNVNYFNYFTEIEEHFQQARGSGLFLLSPLDWAMIEMWKESGVPLDAVHKGIERAFEKWHARKHKTRQVNSLAYCAQEVLTAWREMAEPPKPSSESAPAFHNDEVAKYLRENAKTIRETGARETGAGAAEMLGALIEQTADSLEALARGVDEQERSNLEELEQRLTVLEQRLVASATQHLSEEVLFGARREMERDLAPYRRKMTADQLALFERQYLERKYLEILGLPRLSLFYM